MKTLLLNEGELMRQPFVKGASPDFLNRLAKLSTEVAFKKGETIFTEQEYADRLYLLLSGKVGLETRRNGRRATIQVLGPGEVLGWSWLFPPFQWHFTARALEPCTALELNGASLLVQAEEDPVFGYELMKRISLQVIRRLQATRDRFIHKLTIKERTRGDEKAARSVSPAKSAARKPRLRRLLPRGGRGKVKKTSG